MTPCCRSGRLSIAVVCAVLGTCTAARAQSAEDGFDPGANGSIYAMVVQPDGKVLVGGAFTMLGGGTGTTPRNRIGRFNSDGSLDAGFNPGANSDVYALALQADGKILVGGIFTTLGGMTRNWIGRLNANGSLDTTFDAGANGAVYSLAVQPDGRILIGGGFSTLGGETRNGIGRLEATGSVDMSFNPGANDYCYTIALQPGGKILVGGAFTTMGGGGPGQTPRSRIARLNADGSLDPTFDPGGERPGSPGGHPTGWADPGRRHVRHAGWRRDRDDAASRIGRLNPDGSVDVSFNPGANNLVQALTVQADGKILVGGGFTTLGGGGTGTTSRNYLGRLTVNGLVDATFETQANNVVYAVPVQPDGKILVGGSFTTLSRGNVVTTRNRVARLNGDGSPEATMNPDVDSGVRVIAMQPDGEDPARRVFLDGGRRDAQWDRPFQRRRHARRLQPRCGQLRGRAGGTAGWGDIGWRRFRRAGRRRHAPPDRAGQRRRFARPRLRSRREQCRRALCRCSQMGRFWSAAVSLRWAEGEPA